MTGVQTCALPISKTLQEDAKIDKKIIKGINKKEKRHEAKEGKKGEKLENKREKK